MCALDGGGAWRGGYPNKHFQSTSVYRLHRKAQSIFCTIVMVTSVATFAGGGSKANNWRQKVSVDQRDVWNRLERFFTGGWSGYGGSTHSHLANLRNELKMFHTHLHTRLSDTDREIVLVLLSFAEIGWRRISTCCNALLFWRVQYFATLCFDPAKLRYLGLPTLWKCPCGTAEISSVNGLVRYLEKLDNRASFSDCTVTEDR